MKRLLNLNPVLKSAAWADIKTKREALKREPVTTSMGSFDVDDVSFLNITTSIGSFAAISDAQTNKLTWKLFDNSFVDVSLTDLEEVRDAVAVRAKLVHTNSEAINAGSYTVGDLDDPVLWGL